MDIYVIAIVTDHVVKTEPLGRVVLSTTSTDIASAIQIAIDDAEQRIIAEKHISENVVMHPSQLRQGMKVRPVKTDSEWQVDFRNGERYLILKTTTQSEGIR